jgi:hypothetical protein
MVNEAHMAQRDMPIRTILDRIRHDGCGGRAGKVELLTGTEGALGYLGATADVLAGSWQYAQSPQRGAWV